MAAAATQTTAKMLQTFGKLIDIKKTYTLKEFNTMLTKAYNGKKKREPSLYNIYMKTRMLELKKENPGMDNKLVMDKAAKEWTLKKNENKPNDAIATITEDDVHVTAVTAGPVTTDNTAVVIAVTPRVSNIDRDLSEYWSEDEDGVPTFQGRQTRRQITKSLKEKIATKKATAEATEAAAKSI